MVVIDTQSIIWWVQKNKLLSKKADKILSSLVETPNSIVLSTISVLEIATLIDKGRLTLNMDLETWLEEINAIPAIRIEPLDSYTAIHSRKLPEPFHKDPADRVIVALARKLGVPIVTSDKKIRDYKHVETVW
jgi:PIN domain nuclease of toxin-antitoxin system